MKTTFGKLAIVSICMALANGLLAADIYVSEKRGNDSTGNGSYASPYKTIQKGVDEAARLDVVKILRGTYDTGEQWGLDHTNRVVIGKSITLEGVEGKDVTHVVGYLDPNTTRGHGPAAIRCIAVTNKDANVIIKNLTLRNGGADSENVLKGYGGGIQSATDARNSVYLVDCVISNCVAVMGGGMNGVTAVRCLVTDCRTSGFGVAARKSNLLNCLIHKNKCFGGSGARPALADETYAVNCTITRNYSTLTQGIGRNGRAYNCIVFGNDAVDVDTVSFPITETNRCYTTATDAYLLFSTATENYRLTAGTDAVGGGSTTYLTTSWLASKSISLPSGVAANIDFAGNEIDLAKPICDAGCYQGAVTPGGGRIVFNTGWIVNGIRNETGSGNNSYYTPETWPVSVVARPLVSNVTNFAYSVTSSGYFAYSKNRRYFPLMDGSHVLTPPPTVTDALKLTPQMADLVVYASPTAVAAEADGSLAHPFRTLQDAIVCVTNSSATSPLVLALPGTYEEGGEVVGGVFTRLVLPSSKHITVRSTDGAERTVIKGGVDGSNTGNYAGCGPAAVRCIYIDRGEVTATASAVQGFTIADGHTLCDDYKTDSDSYRGGGILSKTSNWGIWASQVLDCIITNCAAVRCGVSFGTTMFRCKLYDCHGYGGVMRNTQLFSCYVDPSCTLGNAPSDAVANAIFGNDTITRLTTAPDATVIDSTSHYNSLFASLKPNSGSVMWGSVTTNAEIFSANGCAYINNPNFADAAGGDWRLRTTTPARTGCVLPEPGSGDYTTWSTELAYSFHGDIDGKPLSVTGGQPLPGCWQTTVGEKSVFVSSLNGGLSISDGSDFPDSSLPVTVAFSDPASRPCVGCEVNGTTNLFEDAASVTVTASDLAASDYGIIIRAVYSSDWYVNANDGSDLNNGFRPSTPKKTLSGVLALVSSGDTVHAAPGDYNEGAKQHDEAVETSPASRAVLPAGVTLVSDEGADVTFITGASATTPDNGDAHGRGQDAVRCVFMYRGAKLKGFTLRGGHTRYGAFNDNTTKAYDYTGGGVLSPGGYFDSPSYVADTRVEDCVVSNCVALTGGAGFGVTFDRCRLFKCRATRGSAAERSGLVNTIVDDMDSEGGTGIGVANWYLCVNSTLGKNFRRDSTGAADGYALHNQWTRNYGVSNTVVRRSATVSKAVNCVFASNDSNINLARADMVNCRKLTDEECALDAAYRPDCATSLLVDAGATVDVGDTDVYGGQRIYNGAIDIGAVEADWKPMYAKLLDGKGRRINVTAAAPGVSTNYVGGVSAISLHGGETLSLAWGTLPVRGKREGVLSVTGPGTLTMTIGGEPYATITAADGARRFCLKSDQLSSLDFGFSFEGEGAASLYGFNRTGGIMMSFK